MSLKMKITLGVTASVLFTMLAGLFAMRFFVVQELARLEDERAVNNIERCVNAVKNEEDHLDNVLRNLSSSDAVYRFAADRDRRLASGFFSWSALKASGLNCVAIYDAQGGLLGSGSFDLASREAIPLSSLLPKDLLALKAAEEPVRGLVMTPLGPLILSARPVLNAQGWGPARGFMLAGRLLDESLLDTLRGQVRLAFTVEPADAAQPEVLRALQGMAQANPVRIERPDDELLKAYTILPDVLGREAFVVEASLPRQDSIQSRRIITSSMIFVLGSGLAVLGIVLVVLKRSVTGPLKNITQHIAAIKDTRDLGKPLPAGRDDEVGILAGAFNRMGQDLTRLYEQLDRQHAFLKLLITNIPHPIGVEDQHGGLLLANPALLALSDSAGLTAQPGAISKETAQVLTTGAPLFIAEERHVAASGEERWFDTVKLPLEDEAGARRQVLTVRMDITERKRADQAKRDSEKRFKSLFTAMNEGVSVHEIIYDASGAAADYRILDVNPKYEEILGINRETAVGALASTLYKAAGQPPFLDVYANVASTGEPAAFEAFFAPMGRHFSVSAFCPKHGQFATVFQDTTARKRAEEEIKRTHSFIQRTLDSMPSLVVGVDEAARVTHWNKAAAELTGLPAPQALGRHLTDAFPGLAPFMDAVDKTLSEGVQVSRNKLPLMLDGRMRQADLLVFPLPGQDGSHSAVIRVDDVTDRVRMDEILLQTEKMMSVGGLAAGMAHEINNPLAGIIHSAQSVERRLEADLPPNSRAAEACGLNMEAIRCYLETREIPLLLGGILDSGRRAARLVATMLSFVRGGSSVLQTTNLADTLDRAVEIASTDYDMKKKYDFRHIEIVREFASDMPRVPCAPGEIEQVLLNLLQNAAQAIAQNPQNSQAPRITLRLYARKDAAVIEVEDNGPGMPESLRRKVFEPFFTTKSPGEGTGLGLSVSYFIVTSNHQGAIRVESEPGKGARFIISLPLTPSRRDPKPAASA